ncbi:MAG: tRNA (guanosine(37)-N1)-methyltransferase TrmD [Myxococcales bacterium]|nr:tRNA (guanosine(37)-N1)-methyltransferase TrmD [Myxococcales bacterium]
MRFVVATLFPELVNNYVKQGVVGRAVNKGIVGVETIDIRSFSTNKHRTVDDIPFGGGAGMVLMPEPVAQAIESAGTMSRTVLLTPSGRQFRQADAEAWSQLDSILLVCGRYEGIDQRIRDDFVDDAISIGDYVLSGGELGALVVLDATLRLVPGVLGNAQSVQSESYSDSLLEHPHYTRPAQWRGRDVPQVLLSGHHGKIAEWRRLKALQRTAALRPDLLKEACLTRKEKAQLANHSVVNGPEET